MKQLTKPDQSIVEWIGGCRGLAAMVQRKMGDYKPYEFDSYDKAYKCLVKWEGQAVNLVEPEWRVA
jgi:hypothetical protein